MKETDLKRHCPTATALAVVAMATLCACQNVEGIDFDDIDTTVGVVLNDFKLPSNNSTHRIYLDELFDIEPTSCIKTDPDDGHYYFYYEGEDVSVSPVEVKPVTVTSAATDFNAQLFSFTLADLGIDLAAPSRMRAQQPAELRGVIQQFDITEDNLFGDITAIRSVRVGSGTVTIGLDFSADLASVVSELGGLTLMLPDYFVISDNEVRMLTPTDSRIDIVGNDITFTNVKTSQPLRFQIPVSRLDFTIATDEGQPDCLAFSRITDASGNTKGRVRMKGQLVASVRIDQAHVSIDPGKILSGEAQSMTFAIHSSMSISPIAFDEVVGQFQPVYDFNVGDIRLSNVPKFLDDADVDLRLSDPVIELDIDSRLPLTGLVDATLTSHFKDGTTVPVGIEGIEIRPDTRSHVVISTRPKLPADYPGAQLICQPALSSLISAIPERISFDCTATTRLGEDAAIGLGRSYSIQPDYRLNAPFTLKAGSHIAYTDSLDGWRDDLTDINLHDVSNASIVIDADIENALPLDLSVSVTPVDEQHRPIPGISVIFAAGDAQGRVGAATAEGQPATSNLQVRLAFSSNDDFHRLDGIRLRAEATVTDEFTLNSGTVEAARTQYLKVNRLGATLNASVIIDTDSDD